MSPALAAAPLDAAPAHPVIQEQASSKPVPSVSEQLGKAIVSQADEVFQQGRAEVHVRLEPADLGAIRVHLSATDNTLVARVVVSQAGTQHLIEGQAGQLRQTLADSGLILGSFDVRHEAGSGGSGRQEQQQQDWEPPLSSPPPRPAGNAAIPTRKVSPGVVDLLA